MAKSLEVMTPSGMVTLTPLEFTMLKRSLSGRAIEAHKRWKKSQSDKDLIDMLEASLSVKKIACDLSSDDAEFAHGLIKKAQRVLASNKRR